MHHANAIWKLSVANLNIAVNVSNLLQEHFRATGQTNEIMLWPYSFRDGSIGQNPRLTWRMINKLAERIKCTCSVVQ